ncbi:hypothetical protein FB45DRAFT_1103464, partial [Roridomyces roridus]
QDPPDGYLFLCPTEHLQTAPGSFVWPEYPYFWSTDPTGLERLSSEDASARGFPAIQLQTELIGESWDDTVYEGARKFYEFKGVDTESQDLTAS